MRDLSSFRWRTAVLGSVFLVVLLVASTAFAAESGGQPALSVTSPVSQSVVSVWNPSLVVAASDPAGLEGAGTLTIDGTSRPVGVAFVQVGGHWEEDEYDSWWVADYDYTRGTLAYTPSMLSDGSHTATLTLKNRLGSTNTVTWSFTVASPPKFSVPSPAGGSWVTTLTPTPSVKVEDNGAISSWTMLIDGIATPSTYNAAQKTITASGPIPLADDMPHTVSVTATDAAGNGSSYQWQFQSHTTPPAFSSPYPASGSAVAVAPTQLTVAVSDSMGLRSTPSAKIDGNPVSCWIAYAETGGEWVDDGCESWWEPTYDYTRGTVRVSAAGLTNGTHTVTVTEANTIGGTGTYTWNFTIAAPPQLTTPLPANGGWATSLQPTVSAKVTANSAVASYSVTIGGVPASATYDGVTKLLRGTPLTPLVDGLPCPVVARVTDATGLTGTLTWTFTPRSTGPAATGQSPTPGSTLSVASANIGLSVSDPSGFSSSSMKVDGVAVPSHLAYLQTGGEWVSDEWDEWFEPTYDYTRATLTYSKSGLKDGTHTVLAAVTARTGLTTTSSWDFRVAVPPALGSPTPADGGWATTLTPTVSIGVTDNGTIVASTMTIDGAAAVSSYDATTKSVRGVPSSPLADDATHTVAVTVTDDSGNTSSRSWTFRTRTTSPAYSAATPAPGTAVTSYRPRIAVSVSDITGLGTSPVMKLDGVTVPCSFSFLETGGEWVGDEWDEWWEPTYDHTKGTIAYTPSADVANGAHTVWVEAANGIGGKTSYTWDFSVSAPPQLTVPNPANGATIATLTPVISASVKANAAVATVTATIDGVETVALYDAAAKAVRAVPLAPLLNESAHTVSFTVTDVDGLTASLSWNFRTDITPPVLGALAPAPGTTVSVANPRISVDASDWSGMAYAQVMKLDGVNVPSVWAFTETGGEWVEDEYESWWEPTFDLTRGSASYRPAVLRDGPHTVTAQLSNTGGQLATTTWTFDVLVPPALSGPSPTDGSWVGTLTPTISVKVAENDTVASTSVLVDGAAAPSSYDPVTKKVTALPAAPLTDDATHTVVATVTDGAGASGMLTWSFRTHASGPDVSATTPATSTAVWDPVLSVRVQDVSGLDRYPVMKIDGAVVPASIAFDVASEEWVGDEWDSWLEQTFDYTRATVSYRPPKLSDGAHTAYVQVKNSAGNVTVREWTFEVKAPPKLSDPKPGGRVDTTTPVISLAVAENSTVAAVAATINGIATPAEYDASTGRAKVLPDAPLANDVRHSVLVSVTDAAGNSAEFGWIFEVQVYADMPGTGAPDCTGCHTAYPAAHPMDDCNACHGWGGPVEDCRPCHGDGGHGPSEFNDTDWGGPYPCTRCHQPAYGGVPGHYATDEAHETSRDMSACRPCHVSSLTIEHFRYEDPAGAALTCATCHQSTDAGVKAAISGASTDCASCHDIGAGSHVEQHADSVLSAECLTCHESNVVTEHLSNPRTQGATLTCDTCHASTAEGVLSAIGDGRTECGACHDTASAHGDLMGVHTPQDVYSLSCGGAGCHDAGDALALHASRPEGACAVCHANPSRGDLTEGKLTAACGGCHATSGTDYHREMSVHRTNVSTYETCGRCHHAWGSNPIQGHDVTRHAGGCRTCHNGTIDTASLTTDCAQCHTAEGTDYHRQTVAVHTAADAPSQECGRCHDTTNVQVLHEAVGCDTCHSTYTCGECHDLHNGQPGTALLSGVSCSNCHTSAGSDYHAGVATAHTFTAMQPGCQTSGCHTKDLLATHAPEVGAGSENPQYADTCSLCHDNDDPDRVPETATSDCATCHDGHGDIGELHKARNLPTSVQVFTTYHVPGGASVQADCGMCHEVDNIVLIHGSDCAMCHGAARDSFTTWNGTCQQGSCHPSYHTEANAGHAATLEECSISCHGAWSDEIVVENCLQCHTGPDDEAPRTTSDAKASYVGPATVRLSATDLPESGGTGVAHTYWSLDGAAAIEGVTVAIPQPASGSATHSLAFWSVDAKGNVEPTNTVGITVAADTQPPVTTSDAKAEYYRAATIRLTATDNGSSPPVVWYSLDGGTPVAGTVVSVAWPASGAATHTLEFWSVDAAGNTEQHRTVSFAMVTDATAPVTTSDALGSYTDSATVRFTASDAGGSGVAATYWRLDGGPCNTGTAFSTSVFGTHTVEFWSVDGAGNEELPHRTATFTVTSASTGTIRFVWENPPPGAWTYYYVYVYNSYGQLVAQGYNTTGCFDAHVPVSSTPYHLKTYWYEPDNEDGPVTSEGNALIDAPGKIVTWYY